MSQWTYMQGIWMTTRDRIFWFKVPELSKCHKSPHYFIRIFGEIARIAAFTNINRQSQCKLECSVTQQSKEEFCNMINIGSCGLDNVHRAFKCGIEASEWNLANVLKGVWEIYSAWRDIYILICKSQDFPLWYLSVWSNDFVSMVTSGDFNFRPLYLFWNFINCLIKWRCYNPSMYP